MSSLWSRVARSFLALPVSNAVEGTTRARLSFSPFNFLSSTNTDRMGKNNNNLYSLHHPALPSSDLV